MAQKTNLKITPDELRDLVDERFRHNATLNALVTEFKLLREAVNSLTNAIDDAREGGFLFASGVSAVSETPETPPPSIQKVLDAWRRDPNLRTMSVRDQAQQIGSSAGTISKASKWLAEHKEE